MSNNADLKFSWWKTACDKSPDPIAFVDINNRFVFCNNAWCKLLGYSESELKEKTWQDITKIEDIGSDQAEVDNIRSNKKEEYYLEKTYIRKDRSSITIKLYVHRYPENGDHEGYVVFAKRLTSEDYESLKSKFLDLQTTVLILQQNSTTTEYLSEQMRVVNDKLEQNKEIAKMAMDRDRGSINIGDKFGHNSNKAGRDNIQGLSSNAIILITVLIVVSILMVASLCGVIIYLLVNKPV